VFVDGFVVCDCVWGDVDYGFVVLFDDELVVVGDFVDYGGFDVLFVVDGYEFV